MLTVLSKLRPGACAVVVSLSGESRRLAEMGLVPGTAVTVKRSAPLGDPVVISLRGFELALRRGDAARVTVRRI